MTGTSLKVAMVGQRGVPATYGGIEHHVEQLGMRLVDLGHEVTVYCRTNYTADREPEYLGMQLRYQSTINTKHFDAIAQSASATFAAMSQGVDIVHYHALGPGLVSPLPRVFSRAKVVQTVHGLDQHRAKWGRLATSVLSTGCWMSARVPDATVVVSRSLEQYYLEHFGKQTHYIPNGVERRGAFPTDLIRKQFDLETGSYLLFVGRLVPEKAPDLLLRAYRDVPGDLRLVIAGGSSFSDDYVRTLERLAAEDPRVLLAGYVHDQALDELYANSALFVLPSNLEGMPLTLLEAAAHGAPILASDIEPHLEVLSHDAPGRRLFRSGDQTDLTRALQAALANPGSELLGGAELRSRIHREFNWDDAAAELVTLYRSVLRTTARGAPTLVS